MRKQLCDTVVVGVCTRDGLGKELSLLSVPLICEPLSIPPIHHCILEYPHLTSLDLACPSRDKAQKGPDILIGCDFYWDIVMGETVRGDCGPTAVRTKLGWVLSGPISINESHSSASLVTHILRVESCSISDANRSLETQLQAFWDLESLGIREDESNVLKRFDNSITFHDGRYEVTLPWKDPDAVIQDNYQLSYRRLLGLLTRLKKDPTVLGMYDAFIHEQLEKE